MEANCSDEPGEKLAEIKEPPRCSMEEESKSANEFRILCDEIIENAKAMGRGYGPKEYFRDLKRYNEKRMYGECTFVAFSNAWDFQHFMIDNWNKGYYTEEDLERYRAPYEEWANEEYRKRHGPNAFADMSGRETLWWLIFFAISVYWKGMLLMFILYLIRMAEGTPIFYEENGGILFIFLSDKKKFFAALILWPHYIGKYPYNVKNKVIIETELRRLGEPFRRLSEVERGFIRRMAELDEDSFNRYYAMFLEENSSKFRTSFAVSLILTIGLTLVPSSLLRGLSQENCRGPTVVMVSVAQVATNCDTGFDQVADQMQDMLLREFSVPDPLRLIFALRLASDCPTEEPPDQIDHIPDSTGCAIAA